MRSTRASSRAGRCDEHETIDAERKHFEPGDILGACDDADVRLAVRDGGDDLVAESLFEVDVHLRVRAQEQAQRLGQELGQRVRIRQQPHVSLEAVGVLAELAAHAFGLLQQQARVVNQRAPGRRRLHALAIAVQERRAQLELHVADTRAGGGHGQVHALGAGGDAAGFDDVQEQPQVREVEAH
jgi:hypothetical protein